MNPAMHLEKHTWQNQINNKKPIWLDKNDRLFFEILEILIIADLSIFIRMQII